MRVKIKPREWLSLTMDERIVVLRFAVEENRKRWERRLTG